MDGNPPENICRCEVEGAVVYDWPDEFMAGMSMLFGADV